MEKDVLILGIESSCDETAASVVKNGRIVMSNVISSQIDIHTLYGGVVPEIASRKHVERINQVIEQALEDAGVTLDEIDAVSVTYGPGLVGALLVGVGAAKAIAYAAGKPLVGVHHIEGHIAANYLEHPDPASMSGQISIRPALASERSQQLLQKSGGYGVYILLLLQEVLPVSDNEVCTARIPLHIQASSELCLLHLHKLLRFRPVCHLL